MEREKVAWFGVWRGDQGDTRGGGKIFSTSSSLLDGLFKVAMFAWLKSHG